jgi:arabinose-5-phosphate isomerase
VKIDMALAKRVLQAEAAAIQALAERLDGAFEQAVQLLTTCRGRVIVTGIGKSGIICQKIAATFSSTGTPAHFLHAAEAVHGDLGIIQSDDVVLAISHSGETEVIDLVETIKRLGVHLIAITGDCNSTLAQHADVVIQNRVSDEACPLNLVPTASTIAALALGDALAMTLLVAKGFKQEDFANLHPGGKLGKRLMRVEQLMHKGDHTPLVRIDTSMVEVIDEMTSKGLGMSCVVDDADHLLGIITDGDLRRHMSNGINLRDRRASEVMTRRPVTVSPEMLAAEALHILEQRKITSIVVVDSENLVKGVVHLHNLWRTGLV